MIQCLRPIPATNRQLGQGGMGMQVVGILLQHLLQQAMGLSLIIGRVGCSQHARQLYTTGQVVRKAPCHFPQHPLRALRVTRLT